MINDTHSDSFPPAPCISRTQKVHGLLLHYLDYVDASHGVIAPPHEDPRPTMLCIHGGAAHAHWYDFVVSEFTDQYRVLSLDLPGHGDSDWATDQDYSYGRYAADVAEFIDALRLGSVVLAGHSMGGMVALVCAASYQEKLASLIVIDSMMQLTPDRATSMRAIGVGKGRSFEGLQSFIDGFKIFPAGSTAAAHIVRHMAFHSCRRNDDGQWRNKFDRNVYTNRHPINGYEYWARIDIPVLLVAGGASDRITPDVLAQIRQQCEHVVLHSVANAGHHVTLDEPLGYQSAVKGFLSSRGVR
jgi:pimeloyl-ACP methyl ester carboxylesterase